MDKRGSEKYYIIMSLILGLMVLSLGLYFIFNEYFNQDELDWQVCRQSILVRASLPEVDLGALKLDAKGAFPLKCKTEVVTIDSAKTPDEVYGKIADAIASGWYMFGEGKLDFVHSSFFKEDVVCMAFARVHYTEGAISDFENSGMSTGKFNGGFLLYYKSSPVPNSDGTYEDYLPWIFADNEDTNGLIPVMVNFYPNNEDILMIYTMTKPKGILKRFIFNAGYTFSSDIFSKLLEGDEEGWIEYVGVDRSIILVSPDNIDKLGCKFLTIPA